MFQTELDFGTMDAETFTRDVYQRCALCAGPRGRGQATMHLLVDSCGPVHC